MRRFDVWVGRLAAIAGIVYVVLCSLWPPTASGAENEVPDRVGAPCFLVDSDAPDLDRLPLKSTQVDVSIAGVIADVVVTQRYRNEGKRPIEARYLFPGGTRAALYAMNVRIGDRRLTADIRERQQARATYEIAMREGRTAALLEQHRPNVFQMNVAHILPGDDVAVELRYTELIVPQDGRYRFAFPAVVGPRYDGPRAAGGAATDADWGSTPVLPADHAAATAFGLRVALASPIGIKEVVSSSHAVDIARPARDAGGSDRVDIAIAKGGVANDRDFLLDYRLAGDTIESGVLLHRGRDENFFLAMIEPPKQVAATAVVPRETIFVIDISGSMHGYPLETAKALLTKLIGNLRPSDTFNVLLFSGDDSVLAPRSLAATPANLDLALRTIDRQHGGGFTELVPALRHALAMPKDDDRSRTLVVVTDGYVTVEREVFELVSSQLGRANLFAFGIGAAVNRHLIEGLARAGQGEPFVVTRATEAASEAERFRRMIDAPVLTHVTLRLDGRDGFGAYDIEPVAIGDLFASRPVVVFGKWKGRPSGRVIVEGLTATGHFHGEVDLAEAAGRGVDHPALRALWARHRIASLSDQEALADDGLQAGAITELGLRDGLLTSYTSFVAVDRVVAWPGVGGARRRRRTVGVAERHGDSGAVREAARTDRARRGDDSRDARAARAARDRDAAGRARRDGAVLRLAAPRCGACRRGGLTMHRGIRLSPSWPRRLQAHIECRIDGWWSLGVEPVARRMRLGAARLQRLPPWCWPLLVALATWPSATWLVRRLFDDSDDPLGIVALVALMLALWQRRDRFARVARPGPMGIAVALALASNLPLIDLPDLVRASMATIAVVAALAAIADPGEPIGPYAGLAILALPLLSSLQFDADLPLRVVTAEASRWLLAAIGFDVSRLGTASTAGGHLVLVDAPCSGVPMAWVGAFTACVAGRWCRVSDRRFVARLPLVGATALVGNIVRDTLLVAAEADGVAMTDAMHAAIGLLAFAGVATVVTALYVRARRPTAADVAVHDPRTRAAPSSGMAALQLLMLAIAAGLPLANTATA